MKKYFITVILFVVLLTQGLYSIDGFWFKEVALNSEGQILPDTTLSIMITIFTDTDNVLFQEQHNGIRADQFGIFTIKIGNGNIISGDLGQIITRANTRIKTETMTGNSAWIISSVKLLSEVQFFSSIMPGFINLAQNHIIIGDASGNGEDVAVGGDLMATNNGSGLADFQIVADAVTTAEILDGTIQPADLDLGDATNTWTFAGPVDAQSGLDVTGGPLTVVGTAGDGTMDFDVTGDGHISGDFTVDGTLNATLAGVLTDGNGIVDFSYDGSSNATVTVELNGPTLLNGASGISINLANPNTWTGTQTFDVAGGYSAVFADAVDVQDNIENSTGTAVTVNDNLVPATTDNYDLGSDALRWDDLWLNGTTIHIGATNDEGVIQYDENNDVLSFAVEQNGTEEQSLRIDDNQAIYREASGATAGNARGQYSVDLQIDRNNAAQVASGHHSVIGGGGQNTVSGNYSYIGGGWNNQVLTDSAGIAGGVNNTASSVGSFVGGGVGNYAFGSVSYVGGGRNNRASANWWGGATVCGGINNAAINSTAFVGGGIGDTASSWNSVVVGGYLNHASGNNSFIGGGAGNHTNGFNSFIGSGNNNRIEKAGYGGASLSIICGGVNNGVYDTRSFLGGGTANYIFGPTSGIVGGYSNQISGIYSFIGGGMQNRASGDSAVVIAGGISNATTAKYSMILGGKGARTANYGEFAQASGRFKAQADAQTSVMVVRDSTVDNITDVDLKLDGASEDMSIPSNGIWAFRAMIVAADSVAGAAAWEMTGLVHPGGFVGTPNVTAISNPAGWTAPQAVLTPPYSLIIRVRGSTAYRTYWVGRVEVVQIRM